MSKKESSPQQIDILQPAKLGFKASFWLGSEAVKRLAKTAPAQMIGREILFAMDSTKLVGQRLANRVEDEKQSIVKEICERKHDFELVDLNAKRYMKIALDHAEERAAEPDYVVSEEHLGILQRIMADGGLKPKTIEVAIDKLRKDDSIPTAPDDARSITLPRDDYAMAGQQYSFVQE